MLHPAVNPVICQAHRRVARLACVALLLLLAARTTASAAAPVPSAHDPVLSSAVPAAAVDGHADTRDGVVRAGDPPAGAAVFTAISSGGGGIRSVPAAEAGAPSQPPAAVAGVRTTDWDGLWRDTGTFFGTQIVAAGIIYSMPQSVSGWSSEEKKNTFQKYSRNVFDPVFDKDQFYINYVLHPYWGATYYIRGRERGLDRFSAFAYSALISAMYEFGVECFFEKPSIQDLIVTPVAGSLLGYYVFEPWRESIKSKQELRWYDHAALVITDPLGVLSLGIEKVFGIKPTIMVNYSDPAFQRRSPGIARVSQGSRIGAELRFALD